VAWPTLPRSWRRLAVTYDAVLFEFINRFDVAGDQAGLLSGHSVSNLSRYERDAPSLQFKMFWR